MNIKRICRALMCLVLICCLIVQTVPVKTEATGAGFAATIASASSVTVAAPLAVGASLIALGVMADNTNPLVFENVVNDAVDSLSAAGQWVADGTVELLRTVDEDGNAMYYAAGDMLEGLRSWLFNESVISIPSVNPAGSTISVTDYFGTHNYSSSVPFLVGYGYLYYQYGSSLNSPYIIYVAYDYGYITWYGSDGSVTAQLEMTANSYGSRVRMTHCSNVNPAEAGWTLPYLGTFYSEAELYQAFAGSGVGLPSTSLDLSLGQIPTYSLDGTVQDNAFKDYMSKQIRFQNQENPEDPDGDEASYDWMVPLSLGAAGTVYAMTQAEQWLGSTPSDFSDYETVTDYTIVDTPTVGGFPGILTTPNVGSGADDDSIPVVPPAIGGGSTSITPADGLEGTLSDTNAGTFLDSIGSFFGSWFDSILKWLEALWELISSGVISLVEAIAAIPAAISEVFTNVLTWAFAISDTFIATKVEALTAKYPYLDTFLALGTDLKAYFLSLGTKPPIIYIDLGASRGSLPLGGRQAFIDLTWYAEYKSTMDAILGAFIWLWLAWRVFHALPGIINGMSGTVGERTTYSGSHNIVLPPSSPQRELPPGNKRRS